jgi:dTDP-4-amino-4,6-dideoxygalactose transaminase
MVNRRKIEYRVPLMRPKLPRADDILPYLRMIDENRIYSNFGPLNELLEERLADKHNEWFGHRPCVVTTNNGTSALELALQSLRLPPGSKILVPALTFVATCTAVQRLGFIAVACDVSPGSWLMTPDSIAGVDLDGVSAAIPVSTFGAPQDAHTWAAWSRNTGVKVIIDAAAGFNSQDVVQGVAVTFSMHATKPFAAGEGGLVVTCDAEQAAAVKKLQNFGMPKIDGLVGTNAKLSEYHAAVGLAALEAWGVTRKQRVEIRDMYCHYLAPLVSSGDIAFQTTRALVPSVMLLSCRTAYMRDRMQVSSVSASIETRAWYTPLLTAHPALSQVQQSSLLPNATSLAERLIGLPFYTDLQESDIKLVANCVLQSVAC